MTFVYRWFAVLSLVSAAATADGKELTVLSRAVVVPNPAYDTVALVQFPFMIYRHEFEFYRPDSTDLKWYSRIWAQVVVFDSTAEAIDSSLTYFSISIPSPAAKSDTNVPIFNTLNVFLKPGHYSAKLEVVDVVSKSSGSAFVERIDVPVVTTSLKIGATQFAYDLRQATADDSLANARMIHHGLFVLTNPLSVYSDSDSTVYLYGEVYNVPGQGVRTTKFFYTALTEDGQPFLALGSRTRRSDADQLVIAERFDIKGWPEGLYVARVAVADSATGAVDTVNVPFRKASFRKLLAQSKGYRRAFVYDTLSITSKENLTRWLLTPGESQTLGRLSEQGKENFLRQYWADHDLDKSTSENEFLDERMRRYLYANQQFSREQSKADGWKSERGRVHILYGPCDEIDDISVPVTGEALQVWHYRSWKEGKYFIFQQESGGYDYRLVHSNVNGEMYNKKWEQYYKSSLQQSEDVPKELQLENPD